MKKNRKGFTLVELIVVIAVLAILAAIAIPSVLNIIGKANVSSDKANASSIASAIIAAKASAAAAGTDDKLTATDWTAVTDDMKFESLPKIPAVKQDTSKKFLYKIDADTKAVMVGIGTSKDDTYEAFPNYSGSLKQ